jgi:hypothetical protein
VRVPLAHYFKDDFQASPDDSTTASPWQHEGKCSIPWANVTDESAALTDTASSSIWMIFIVENRETAKETQVLKYRKEEWKVLAKVISNFRIIWFLEEGRGICRHTRREARPDGGCLGVIEEWFFLGLYSSSIFTGNAPGRGFKPSERFTWCRFSHSLPSQTLLQH